MKLFAKRGLEPRLNAEAAVPRNALEISGYAKATRNSVATFWTNLARSAMPPDTIARYRGGEGQQEEEFD